MPRQGDDEGGPQKSKLVRIRVFSGPTARMQAELARNILREQGIPCALPGEYAAEALPGIDVVQLLVRAGDGERASEILASFLDNTDSEIASGDENSDD